MHAHTHAPVAVFAGGMGLVVMFLQGGGWSEAWFVALVAFHLFSTFVVVTSTHQPTRASLFCLLCAVAQLAENLNAVAAIHWKYVELRPVERCGGACRAVPC